MAAELKPYRAYKDSGVEWLGAAPAHWEVRRLKQICRMGYGDSLADGVRQDGTVPVFGSNGRVGVHNSANTKAPCIVIGRKGSFGKINYCPEPVFAIDTTFVVDSRFDPNADTRSTRSHVFPLVPRTWTLRRLRSLLQRVRRPISVRPDTEYREIGIRSWGKGIFHKDSVPGAVLGEKNVFRIEPGDFVLNIVFAWEGAVSVVSENETGMIASHRFPTFRPSPDVDVDYLLMVFQSEKGRRLMEINSPGAAGRNRTLRIGQFLEEEIPLPTLDAQRAIVAAFRHGERRFADCVGRTRQAVHQLKELRSRLIADVVTGKLDVREAAARFPEADPPIAEGDSDDGVDSQTRSEWVAWQQAVEDGGALPDVTDAEQSEATPAGTMTEGR